VSREEGNVIEDREQEALRRSLSPLLTAEEFRPLSASVTVEVAAASHAGKVRPLNEDHYMVLRLNRSQETILTSLSAAEVPGKFNEYGYGIFIADGLGGEGPGAVASRLALSTLAHLLIHFGKWNLRLNAVAAKEVMERAGWFYQQINEAVVQRGKDDPQLAGMMTTMTAAFTVGDDIFLAHVGHTRAYLFRDGELTQLTSDQTVERRMTDAPPRPAAVERATEDLKHILTEALGGKLGGPAVDVTHFRLWDNDIVLFCTDGLTGVVDDERIGAVLNLRRRPQEQCQTLVDLALEAGGPDNVTVLLAEYRVPRELQ